MPGLISPLIEGTMSVPERRVPVSTRQDVLGTASTLVVPFAAIV